MKRRAFTHGVLAAGLLAHPLRSAAQRIFRIGFLSSATPGLSLPFDALSMELRELGYVEGQDFVFESRWAGGRSELLPELAAELVRLPVDVIVTQGAATLNAAVRATKIIPIVMIAGSADPVGEGLAASLARPGGNVTGLAYAVSPERFAKELELLKAAVPALSRVAVSFDSDEELYRRTVRPHLETAARKLGLSIQPPVYLVDEKSLDDAFATIRKQRADALLVLAAGGTYELRGRLADFALAQNLPTVGAFKWLAQAGALMSYGPDTVDMARRAGSYIDRIRKGAKPGDLPIELPRRDEFIINLKTARALGLAIPQSLLLRADEVIQ